MRMWRLLAYQIDVMIVGAVLLVWNVLTSDSYNLGIKILWGESFLGKEARYAPS